MVVRHSGLTEPCRTRPKTVQMLAMRGMNAPWLVPRIAHRVTIKVWAGTVASLYELTRGSDSAMVLGG